MTEYGQNGNVTHLTIYNFIVSAFNYHRGSKKAQVEGHVVTLIRSLKGLLTRSTHARLCVTHWQEHLLLSLENVLFTVSTPASHGMVETVFVLDFLWPVLTFFWLHSEGSVIVKWLL